MKVKIEGKKKVEKFLLDDDADRAIYESLLNNEKVSILRDNLINDIKSGRTSIVVWYQLQDD